MAGYACAVPNWLRHYRVCATPWMSDKRACRDFGVDGVPAVVAGHRGTHFEEYPGRLALIEVLYIIT